MTNIILFNKPYGVISQFSPSDEKATLADYIKQKGFYPAGRLDHDSEGLLLLTNDGALQHQITDPKHKLPKTYWVQVEGLITKSAIDQLSKGVVLKDGLTKPAKTKAIDPPPVWDRNPPIRERKAIPTSWIELTIKEGKNRQVRRMTAAVKHPTLRLIRASIGDWSIEGLALGETRSETVNLPETPKKEKPKKKNYKKPYSRNGSAKSKHSKPKRK